MVAMRIAELYPSGWHTARVDRIEAPTRPAAVSPRVLARWVLLCAVIAGVFVLHVLSSEHDHNGHGDPVAGLATGHLVTHLGAGAATGPDNTTAAPMGATLSDPVTPIGDGDGGWLSGCILFLVVAGTGALLTLAMRRRAEGSAPAVPAAVMGVGGVMNRRGPPPGRVRRLALGVIRV
jgi:hypothetical protein